MQTFNPVLKRGLLCIRAVRLNTIKTILACACDSLTSTQYFAQRVTTDSSKHSHITTQKLIPINSQTQTTPPFNTLQSFNTTRSRNIHAPKQTHPTLNTPPLSRTDPHTFTQSGSVFSDAGCGRGWSVSVTPACPSRLIFGLLTNIKGKAGLCDAMQRFSSELTAAVCFCSC